MQVQVAPQNSCHSGGFEMVGWPKAGLVENLKSGEVKTSAELTHRPQPEKRKQLQPEEGVQKRTNISPSAQLLDFRTPGHNS